MKTCDDFGGDEQKKKLTRGIKYSNVRWMYDFAVAMRDVTSNVLLSYARNPV